MVGKTLSSVILTTLFSLLASANEYAPLVLDDSQLAAAGPIESTPVTRAVRLYRMESEAVDRRLTCTLPTTNTTFVVELSHVNDQGHTATLQLLNSSGEIEASFLTTASRLPRYPDVNLDSYKIRFGEELSTLVINVRRGENKTHLATGVLQSDHQTEILKCTDHLVDASSIQGLEQGWDSSLNEVKVQESELPENVCSITSAAKQVCSAVMIGEDLALTANHCLKKLTPDAQITCPQERTSQIDLEKSISNEIHSADPSMISSDLAILKLKIPLAVKPALLVTSAAQGADLLFTQTLSCRLFGFGHQFDGTTGSLHGVKLAFPPEELGGLSLAVENYESEHVISTDPRYFMRPGDSGGGILCAQGDDEFVVGIHSLIYPIDSSVNSVSVGHNNQWLRENLDKLAPVKAETEPVTPEQSDTSQPLQQL